MLKIKIDNAETTESVLLDKDTLYLGEDASWLSGTTPFSNALAVAGEIFFESQEGESSIGVPFTLTRYLKQGYILVDEMYVVSTNDAEEEYIIYNGTKRYASSSVPNAISVYIDAVGDRTYEIQEQKCGLKYVMVPTVHYVKDAHVTIKGERYKVDFNPYCPPNSAVRPRVILGDNKAYEVYDGEESKWQDYADIFISGDTNFQITIEDVKFSGIEASVSYNGVEYILEGKENDYTLIIEDGPNTISAHTYGDFFEIGGEILPVKKTICSTDVPSNELFVFIESSDVQFVPGDTITLEGRDEITVKANVWEEAEHGLELVEGEGEGLDETKHFITYNGENYQVSDDTYETVTFADIEYDIEKYQEADENAYLGTFIADNEMYFVKVDLSTNTATRIDADQTSEMCEITGTVKSYRYVIIKDQRFKVETVTIESTVETGTPQEYLAVFIKGRANYTLEVIDVMGSGTLKCVPQCYDIPKTALSIYNNWRYLQAKSIRPIFPTYLLRNNSGEMRYDNDGEDTISEKLGLYVITTHSNVVFGMSKNVSIRPNFESEIEDKHSKILAVNEINSITDNERDIYYPAIKKEDGQYAYLSSMLFDIHFRTRDLDTWSVINDSKSKVADVNIGNNWPFFDIYWERMAGEISQYVSLKNKYQPSDLLYFLGFTDNDVISKNKSLSKSCLRLSFFDSMDAENQTLLYTSAIYLDADELYNKYIATNAPYADSNGARMFYDVSDSEQEKNEYNGVSKELIKDGSFLFDETYRLSSQIKVSDKLESKKTSDGFYIYIYKDYSSYMVPQDIYMRVQFINAKYGKVCNMCIPVDKEGKLIDLNDKEGIDSLEDGRNLKNLVYQLYTPLTVSYDFGSKRYCYELPTELISYDEATHTAHINLYESKVQDESQIFINDRKAYISPDYTQVTAFPDGISSSMTVATAYLLGELTCKPDVEWIRCSCVKNEKANESGQYILTYTVDPFPEGIQEESRKGFIILSDEYQSVTVDVEITQYGRPFIELVPDEVSFKGNDEGEYETEVYLSYLGDDISEVTWDIDFKDQDEWITDIELL